ncbi:glycosyltransferase family 25 protein [Acetobacter estunensis]|uniref:glycosyltransferase family 25 protein n=1 Tax=Acetobacter estunensis TaxID=104097 RepID=UPI001C2CCCC6|nr:glycosyltransferase family 25 protein [Acetobacter estunensis]MBV1837827.1 glycosyltransferase family 25 protein [Acetobacter estunensis]
MTKTLIRVISIAGSVRRDTFHCPPTGVEWEFFDASRGLEEGFEYNTDVTWAHIKRGLAPGEIGCYCSHVRAWRSFLSDPTADQILIVEDDVYVDWPVTLHLTEVDWASKGVHFLKFFGRFPARLHVAKWNYPIWDRHVVQYETQQFGTQIYLLTRHAAEVFVQNFQRISRPIDVEMERPWATGIPVAGIVPPTALELSVPSCVMNRHADRQATYLEMLRYYSNRVFERIRGGMYRTLGPRVKINEIDLSRSVFDYRNQ